jgi:enoyl-CoA hydratase
MKYKSLLVTTEGSVTIVTLNRPEKLNVIDTDMLEGLDSVMRALEKSKSCRAVIITGSGDKSFCAGADIKYLNSLKNEKDAAAFAEKVHSVFDRIENLEKPVIAAVNGYCLGGGCELAMACDIRIATPNAVFGQPEVKLGIMPGGGGTYRLPALVGIGRAKELILGGDSINADVALEIGLINRIADRTSLVKEATATALKITQNSYNAVKKAKLAINANAKRDGEVEKKEFASCFSHPDRKEGIGAFIEHRKPEFE